MKNQGGRSILIGFVLLQLFVFPAWAIEDQKGEVVETRVSMLDYDRRLKELEHAFSNFERKMDHLEDRVEKLDRDLKELNRKV